MTKSVIPLSVNQLQNESKICPYLCLRSDERTSARYPRNDHQCSQAGNALITHDWQRRYCLGANHQRCRTFHFPEFYRPRNTVQRLRASRQNPLRVGLLAAAGMIIFLAGAIGALEGVKHLPEREQWTTSGQPPSIRLYATEALTTARASASSAGPQSTAEHGQPARTEWEPERNPAFTFLALDRFDADNNMVPGVGGVNPGDDRTSPGPVVHSEDDAPADPIAARDSEAPHESARHMVQPGETLWLIAQHYGATVESIMLANELEDPDHIQAGIELTIP